MTGVEVLADHLLEEHPPGQRPVEHLGKGELDLEDRDVVVIASTSIGVSQWTGQASQPLVHEGLHMLGAEAVADRLQGAEIAAACKAVVEGVEADTGLGGLALSPVMHVEQALAV